MTDQRQPLPFDPEAPRCREHRHVPAGQSTGCPACAEARAWVQRRRDEQEAAAEARLRDCPMCDRTGQRWDPDTHIPMSPLRSCDHETPHHVVVAELRAAELAAEQARAVPAPRPPVPSTAAGRARARAMFQPRRVRPSLPAQRATVDPVGREEARRELVAAAAVATGKSGQEAGGAPVVDQEVAS